jgi:hypothetical protein
MVEPSIQPKQIYADIIGCNNNQIVNRLANGKMIDYRKLRIWLFETAKKSIELLHPDWVEGVTLQPGSINRLCEINIQNDIANNLPKIIEEFLANIGDCSTDTSQTSAIFEKSTASGDQVRPIDAKKYKGGATALHQAVMSGNISEVRRLVEVEKARVDVRDNSGMTPLQVAMGWEFSDIAEYLSSF